MILINTAPWPPSGAWLPDADLIGPSGAQLESWQRQEPRSLITISSQPRRSWARPPEAACPLLAARVWVGTAKLSLSSFLACVWILILSETLGGLVTVALFALPGLEEAALMRALPALAEPTREPWEQVDISDGNRQRQCHLGDTFLLRDKAAPRNGCRELSLN